MTPEALQRDCLSLRYWVVRCVLPSAVVLFVILIALKVMTETERALDHKAIIAGFFTLYFILVRGGHVLMIRSLHMELQKKYPDRYREKLMQLAPDGMKRRNVGFTLARIKRELIDDKRARLNQFKR